MTDEQAKAFLEDFQEFKAKWGFEIAAHIDGAVAAFEDGSVIYINQNDLGYWDLVRTRE